MTKYRIVTRLYKDATREVFAIQQKNFIIWWGRLDWRDKEIIYFHLEEAKRELATLVAADEAEKALSQKHKKFKSKAVYGPYPP